MITLLAGAALFCASCGSTTSEALPFDAVDESVEGAASESRDELGVGEISVSADKAAESTDTMASNEAQSQQSNESGVEERDETAAQVRPVSGNPPMIFGRRITADELVGMLREDSGQAQVVEAMVSSTTLNDEQAACMISSLSYETFVTVANGERPTNTQAGELTSAFEVCGIE